MKAAGASLNTHIQGEATTLAQFWKVRRTDGVVFYFTSHDQDLDIDIGDGDGSATYEAEMSFKRTAIVNNDELAVDNLDVEGLLRSDKISETELRRGLFDFAEVWVFIANYESLGDGFLRMRRGWFGEVTITPNGIFRTELRGMTQVLARVRSAVYQPECPFDLGDGLGSNFGCGVPIRPDEVTRNTSYAVGEYIRASNTKYIALTVTNGDAETGDTSGWTNTVGVIDVRTAAPAPFEGTYHFGGGISAEARAHQDISVPAPQESAVDAGERQARLSWHQNSFAGLDTGEMEIEFFDGSLVSLGARVGSGLTAPTSWTARDLTLDIPATTRTIRISMHSDRNSGVNNDGLFDAINLELVDTAILSEDFDDRIYICATAGTTANQQPTYDTTPGNDTTDGTAVFTAEEAWSRAIEVVAVGADPRKTFTVTELTPNSGGTIIGRDYFPDDAINGGVVIWESGDNAGRAMEVKNLVADDGITIIQIIDLFLQMPYDIQIGDKARVYRGCDKSRATCRDVFGQGRRFGGFPDVPGQQVFTYPDAKS